MAVHAAPAISRPSPTLSKPHCHSSSPPPPLLIMFSPSFNPIIRHVKISGCRHTSCFSQLPRFPSHTHDAFDVAAGGQSEGTKAVDWVVSSALHRFIFGRDCLTRTLCFLGTCCKGFVKSRDLALASVFLPPTTYSFNIRHPNIPPKNFSSGDCLGEGLRCRTGRSKVACQKNLHQTYVHCDEHNHCSLQNFDSFVPQRSPYDQPGNTTIKQTILVSEKSSWSEWRMKGFLLVLPGVVGLNMVGLNMEGFQSVLQALGVLTVIISVHECGHFLAARLQNIHVTQFSIGFGPKLVKMQRKNVEYSIRAIPFGGFVGFPDDDPDSEFSPEDPDLLKNRPILDRAIVVSAGVVANIMFAYTVLFSQVLTVGFLEQQFFPGVVVPEVIQSSAAERAGVKAGDVIISVNGQSYPASQGSVSLVVETIKKSPGTKLSFLVMRGGDTLNLNVVPDESLDGSGRIGVQLAPNARPHRVKALDLAEAAVQASTEFWSLTKTVLDGLKQVLFNFSQTADKLSGPVAIVAVGAEVARADAAGLFQFAAIVNINLAVINLLPLPALDGGYLALIVLEAVRGGKKLPTKLEQSIMSSGILLLFALGFTLMVKDTLNLGIVQQRL